VLEAIDTSDGSKGAVTAKLDGKGARVVIQTGADDATVIMSGVVLGAGKKVDLGALARGRYIVEVQAPGRKTASGKVVVPAAGRAAYRADLVAEDARGRSTLDEARAFYEHWAFWTAVGVGAAGATTGAIVAAQGNQPVPLPDGDVSVPLP
jgi:predicted ATPase